MSGYGRHFASMYTGSMVGMGTDVFAVWGYVIGNVDSRDGTVELNPRLLAGIFGSTADAMRKSIDALCQPDPESRNPDEEGRRLIHEHAFSYRVVSAQKYYELMLELNQRESNASRQAKYRADHAAVTSNAAVTESNGQSRDVTDSGFRIQDSNSESDPDGERTRVRAARKKPAHRMPVDFRPDEAGIACARELKLSPERIAQELTRFVEHAEAHDRRLVDWQAGWRMWLRKSIEFERPSGSHRIDDAKKPLLQFAEERPAWMPKTA